MFTAGNPSRLAPDTLTFPGIVSWLCHIRFLPCQGKCGLASSMLVPPDTPCEPTARALLPMPCSRLTAIASRILSAVLAADFASVLDADFASVFAGEEA
ncbi:hypothetical protein SMICM17S_04535 [Streptomyces microflavus]